VSLRILIVEDEQIIAADLANKVRGMGHDVVGTAIAGDEAINVADNVRPDLVFMDVQLEDGMTGTASAQIIQERTGAQVIFVTANPGVFLSEPHMMTEPGICLEKPFSSRQLEAALAAAAGRWTDRQNNGGSAQDSSDVTDSPEEG